MTMNWMIDGLYGDLYRTAMGYRALTPHDGASTLHDEWEIERHLAKKPSLLRRAQAAMRKLWATERAALHLPGTQVSAKERTAS
jgi:hypothetical protein